MKILAVELECRRRNQNQKFWTTNIMEPLRMGVDLLPNPLVPPSRVLHVANSRDNINIWSSQQALLCGAWNLCGFIHCCGEYGSWESLISPRVYIYYHSGRILAEPLKVLQRNNAVCIITWLQYNFSVAWCFRKGKCLACFHSYLFRTSTSRSLKWEKTWYNSITKKYSLGNNTTWSMHPSLKPAT